jgi:hypothetical protein
MVKLTINFKNRVFYKNKPKIIKNLIMVIVPVYFLILGNLLN